MVARDSPPRLRACSSQLSASRSSFGLIRGTGLPVPVVTTSGTAGGKLHPPGLEAAHSGPPLIGLGADQRGTADLRQRLRERCDVARDVAGRVGIGDVLREQRLAAIRPGQTLLREVEQGGALGFHARNARRKE